MNKAKTLLKHVKIDEVPMKKSTANTVKKNIIEVQAMINNCAKLLAPVWPLETFIACNPLQGFEEHTFKEALTKSGFKRERFPRNPPLEAVNLQMIKWCGVFFDKGQAAITMPHRDKGFYFGFIKLAYFDKKLHQNKKALKQWLSHLPECAEETIKLCLDQLKVPAGKEESFITQTLFYLPGWAGYLKRKTQWNNPTDKEETPFSLIDFVAVRLIITCLLWPEAAQEKQIEADDSLVQNFIGGLTRNEEDYAQNLLPSILSEVKKPNTKTQRPDAQFVFCIDVRSEPFRRAIEQLGNYETFGFAGFFGLPIRVKEFTSGKVKDCCPVLLKPRYQIDEEPKVANAYCIEQLRKGAEIKTTLSKVYQQLKYNFSTPFALVESLGAWCGISMLLKSIAPHLTKRFSQSLSSFISPNIETEPAFELNQSDLKKGISLNEQIAYAETVLRLMGFTSGFAKLVILCGHGSSTENNPYASALDCGACGGNHGGDNAKLLAAILNKKEVRKGLEDKGIHVPSDTVFYAALHNTTTDAVTLYHLKNSPIISPNIFNQLLVDLEQAKLINNLERGKKLNSMDAIKDIKRRSEDWSETRPEWGLARNAAFIVAPRSLTRNINLDGRCFLHSYDWENDAEGDLLETILTAPMVVAQWINTQYLFSTIDNVAFGSGSKITINVTGKIGVMQGNGSDLMHGLSLQSVMNSDLCTYHQPQRLLTVVYAPRKLVYSIIEKQAILKMLFFNEWVHLVVIEPNEQLAYKFNKTGDWILAQ
mgnify:CR=1 FL=1